MAAVEENGDFALTKARLTRLNGGGGRGDHGEARSKTAGAFLQWQAQTATAKLDRNWRGCGGFGAARCGSERKQMEQATRSGRRAGCSRRGQQRQEARGAWQHEQKAGDECHPRVGRFLKR